MKSFLQGIPFQAMFKKQSSSSFELLLAAFALPVCWSEVWAETALNQRRKKIPVNTSADWAILWFNRDFHRCWAYNDWTESWNHWSCTLWLCELCESVWTAGVIICVYVHLFMYCIISISIFSGFLWLLFSFARILDYIRISCLSTPKFIVNIQMQFIWRSRGRVYCSTFIHLFYHTTMSDYW